MFCKPTLNKLENKKIKKNYIHKCFTLEKVVF